VLNRLAEEYFSTLKNWDHHLAKPFADVEEAPDLLTDVAILLRGLRLRAGARVVDFGSGPGWLSRFLTQLGCETVLLDVSPTALAIGRQLYERLPVIGDCPAPEFVVFDGRRIALPDASVDRIMSFHAFHHVPNPDAVIAEFARVLKPGGVAGFVEPGPRHSETPVSQFEMRTYGVIERDIDVHAIWRAAQGAGFSALELAVWHAPLFHLSLERYEDFLAGGATAEQWTGATRDFARHVRTFFLTKQGEERLDSRSAAGLACTIRAAAPSRDLVAGAPISVAATVTNTGKTTWLRAAGGRGSVWLGAHLHRAAGGLITFDIARVALSDREIAPGESVNVTLMIPPQAAGHYRLELDCVADGVTWFAQIGPQPPALDFTIV
jgi:SAM-dependent methyltransferase